MVQARPQADPLALKEEPVAITSYTYNVPDENGAFNYAFEAENGIKQEATGGFKIAADGTPILVMQGSYEYVDADGLIVTVTWIADDAGYRILSAIPELPKPVEIPYPEIQEAVDAQIAFAAATEATAIVEV